MVYIVYLCLFFCAWSCAENRETQSAGVIKAQVFVEHYIEQLEKSLQSHLNYNSKRSLALLVAVQELIKLHKTRMHNDARSQATFPLLRTALLKFVQNHELTNELFYFAQQTNLSAVLNA